jgi:hypothetical protein
LLGFPKKVLDIAPVGKSQESIGKTFSDDEFIEKLFFIRPNISQDSSVFVHPGLVISQTDLIAIKIKKREPPGQQGPKSHVLSRVIYLRGVYTNKPNPLGRAVRKLNLDGIAVIDHDYGARVIIAGRFG